MSQPTTHDAQHKMEVQASLDGRVYDISTYRIRVERRIKATSPDVIVITPYTRPGVIPLELDMEEWRQLVSIVDAIRAGEASSKPYVARHYGPEYEPSRDAANWKRE